MKIYTVKPAFSDMQWKRNLYWYRQNVCTSSDRKTRLVTIIAYICTEPSGCKGYIAQEPLPGGHEIYHFGGPFRGHHYYILSLSNLCLGVEKKIFKEIMHFHYMTYMAMP